MSSELLSRHSNLVRACPRFTQVSISQHLHSPKAHIATFIYGLLTAYTGEPQGLGSGATLFFALSSLQIHLTES